MSLKFKRPESFAIYKMVATKVCLDRWLILSRKDTKEEMLEIFGIVNRVVSELYDADTQISTSVIGLCGAVHILIDDPHKTSRDAIFDVKDRVGQFENYLHDIIEGWGNDS